MPNILARKSEEGPLPYCKPEQNRRVTIDRVPVLYDRLLCGSLFIDSIIRRNGIWGTDSVIK
jgi:hypothetical protein